jgi:hypothetical protein
VCGPDRDRGCRRPGGDRERADRGATLIDYVLTNNGGLTDTSAGFGIPVSITGEFTYDTVAVALTAVDLTVSSTPNLVFDGTYTQLSGSFVGSPISGALHRARQRLRWIAGLSIDTGPGNHR